MSKHTRTTAGAYYFRDAAGRLTPAPAGVPDVIICRRVADFPGQAPPAGAVVGVCSACQAPIAYNPARHPDRPRTCMQCAGIQPEPFPH